MDMQKGFLKNSRTDLLGFINRIVDESPELKQLVVHREKGEVLFHEGEALSYLYLLLEGSVRLTHRRSDDVVFEVLTLKPGHFIGLVAFNTGNLSLTTATASEKIRAIKLSQKDFELYLNKHPILRMPLQQLMMSNMTDRFESNLELESRMHALNQKLEEEGEELKEAYRQLEESQQKLVHREKMATLGELVAGFAHEVNNPASALLRSSENLIRIYQEMPGKDARSMLFETGLKATPLNSQEIREEMQAIEASFPDITERPLIRKMAQMPESGRELVRKHRNEYPLSVLIQHFEAGKYIHNIRIASTRIANLVKSLKSYSRQDNNKAEMIDIRDGIRDTVLVLSNRLKYVDLELDLQEIPLTCARMEELNQVWTNILINACDVLEENGAIRIRTSATDQKHIKVEISDNGPGIPEHLLDRVFEPNFTTKNQGAKFGLGLGLAISEQVVRQHEGSIKAKNNPSGGTTFITILPVKYC